MDFAVLLHTAKLGSFTLVFVHLAAAVFLGVDEDLMVIMNESRRR